MKKMKKMKCAGKLLAGILILVMSAMVFTGCAVTPGDELETFINTDMTDVNANYEKIKAESGKWGDYEDDSQFIDSIEKVILPLIDDSLNKTSEIELQTDEVKSIKDKYINVMNAYKEGYTKILEAFKTSDENLLNEGSGKIDEGIKLLDEYNKALEDLAKEYDLELQY